MNTTHPYPGQVDGTDLCLVNDYLVSIVRGHVTPEGRHKRRQAN